MKDFFNCDGINRDCVGAPGGSRTLKSARAHCVDSLQRPFNLPVALDSDYVAREMFGVGFELATILRTRPDGLTRVIVRSSWSERESILVRCSEAEAIVLRRWSEFHEKAVGVSTGVALKAVPAQRRSPWRSWSFVAARSRAALR
jgi:hypothetical protein